MGGHEDAGQSKHPFPLNDSRANFEGQLLHLHPLTLEDILQQEPREKLELFPKLGYYFIVFRALESSTAPERLDAISQKTGSSQPQDHGAVNEINVYLVVFRGGICTVSCDCVSTYTPFINNKASSTFRTSQVNNIHERVFITKTDRLFADHLDRVRGKLETTAQTARKSSGMLQQAI
jgi:Mg2+ and Co2+ transporter CorA